MERKISFNKKLDSIVSGLERLVIYRNIYYDDVVQSFLSLADKLLKNDSSSDLINAYHSFFGLLAAETELSIYPQVGNPLQNYLINLILIDENTFSVKAQEASLEEMGKGLISAVKNDLRLMQQLFKVDAEDFRLKIQAEIGTSIILPPWNELKTLATKDSQQSAVMMKKKLLATDEWSNLLQEFGSYYEQMGSGIMAKYQAFRWDSLEKELRGIPSPDPIRLENLVGYIKQKETLVENTKYFLAGFHSNNILLYGDRGTGKSSMVKALLHAFPHTPLRLVEITQQQLKELAQILAVLRSKPQRFIVFIDDLSFEEYEVEFKYLKAVLEGSLESRPQNVLIYATSNRRHLVKEYLSERETEEKSELHSRDTVQEKLSLADRFGINLTFTSPDKDQYLEIVARLAEERGINLPAEELQRRAMAWELWHNVRSGRTARQFIDYLSAQISAAK